MCTRPMMRAEPTPTACRGEGERKGKGRGGDHIISWHRHSQLHRCAAQAYVRRIEALVGVPVAWVGTGPARTDMVTRGFKLN